MPAALRDVSISDYGTQHPPLALVDVPRCLGSCRRLADVEFVSLTLDHSYTGPAVVPGPGIRSADVAWDYLRFANMPGQVIGECNRLLIRPYVETVSSSRCTM